MEEVRVVVRLVVVVELSMVVFELLLVGEHTPLEGVVPLGQELMQLP